MELLRQYRWQSEMGSAYFPEMRLLIRNVRVFLMEGKSTMTTAQTLHAIFTPARVEPGSRVRITIGGLPSDVDSVSIFSAVIDGGEMQDLTASVGQDGAVTASADIAIRADVSPGEQSIEVRRGGPDGDVLGNVALTVSERSG
jgi:hypothetical protein